MEKQIKIRMEYVNKSYAQQPIVYALKNAHGMSYISQILAQSDTYAKMKSSNQWNDKISFEENKNAYKKKYLQSISDEDKQSFKKIESIYNADKKRFWELYV